MLLVDYNISWAMRIAESERWFLATFEFWPTNTIEPIIVPMGNVERIAKKSKPWKAKFSVMQMDCLMEMICKTGGLMRM
uniref:Uncharacterized protein n=1 Tax=Romanomermis culicivorax TaxID=13658 RepID=A0A915II07_ROMCU